MSQKTTITELATGKLPARMLQAIGEMEVTASEMVTWYESRPRFQLNISDKAVVLELKVRLPIKKSIAILAALISLLGATFGIVLKFLPLFQSLIHMGLPVP